MIKLTGALLALPDGLEKKDLYINDRYLSFQGEETETLDVSDSYIFPGFIDIHSDYIEHMAAPRPTSLMDLKLSLLEAERELLLHGITTMFHSLSLYKEDVFEHKPIRKPDNVRTLMGLIKESHGGDHLLRHRLHARFEVDNLESVEAIEEALKKGEIQLLSFMDHTPGQGQYRNIEVYKKTLKGYRDLDDETFNTILEASQKKTKLSLEKIEAIIRLAKEHGVPVASHDDDSEEKVSLMRDLGCTISEFPITLEAATKAKENQYVAMGAPNILLGGSHSGNLCAATAIKEGVCNILCSDYYPSSLLHAIFKMHLEKDVPLHEMVNMVTLNPALACGLKGYGALKEGYIADFLVIELIKGVPMITKVFVDGKLLLETNYRRS